MSTELKVIEKYTNEFNMECYRNVELDSPFSVDMFHKTDFQHEDDLLLALHTNLGSLTVLDRVTGFSGYIRDVETGFRDPDYVFWLASGNLDVRNSGAETFREAIEWVKLNANTCSPD